MNSKVVPIVFSTDDNYVMPTAVAIRSIIRHYSGEKLVFYILVKKELERFSREMIFEAAVNEKNINVEIQYLILGDKLEGVSSHISHISVATYYRLFLPELLLDYARCLYLDGDVVIKGDIRELLECKMSRDEYIAGVRVAFFYGNKRSGIKRANLLGIKDANTYVNAGVLLMNLEALREQRLANEMVSLVSNNYPVQDQDILNKVCYGHIKILVPKFNAMPSIRSKSLLSLKKVYDKESIFDARNTPTIIHYADRYKPWKYKDLAAAEDWSAIYYELFGKVCIDQKKIGLKPVYDKLWQYVRIMMHKIKVIVYKRN